MKLGARKDRQDWGYVAGMLFSYKMAGLPIRWVSILMYEAIMYLEFDPDVVWYKPFPFHITKQLADREFTLSPELHVNHRGGDSLVLCRWRNSLGTERVRAELEVVRSWARMNNYGIQVVTENELRSGHRLRNITLLWRFRNEVVSSKLRDLVASYLEDAGGKATLKVLASVIAGPAVQYPLMSMPLLHSMLFHGYLSTHLECPISPSSTVWITTSADDGTRRSPMLSI